MLMEIITPHHPIYCNLFCKIYQQSTITQFPNKHQTRNIKQTSNLKPQTIKPET